MDFEKHKKCGNDPTTYYYSETWTKNITKQLNQLGFQTILFNSDTIQTEDNIPRILITCYLKNNDFFETEINLHFLYQKNSNVFDENVVEKDVNLKLNDGLWLNSYSH